MKVLDAEMEQFRKRTGRSGELYREATAHVPFGVNSNYRYIEPYPLYFKEAKGTSLWDVDGNRYIDFNMGYGALVTGHAHPTLVEAMQERVGKGTLYGYESVEMPALAKHFCERFHHDRVKFNITGADATQFALRLARAHTGRKKVLKFEGCYHGSHDSLMVSVKPSRSKAGHPKRPNSVPSSQGVLPEVVANTVVAPFNDLEAVEALVEKHAAELAAIILEPIPMNMGFILPRKGYLEGLRRLCDDHGVVLIFDEVKTSGKFYGGAQEAFGVAPDLAAMGKAIGGGYPIAAVAGRRELMDTVVPGQVAHAGTYNSNPLSTTAALVTLTRILTPVAMKGAANLGNELGRGYEDIAEDEGLGMKVNYMGISGQMHFTTKPVVDWRSFLHSNVAMWFYYHTAMMNRGIIPAGTGPDEQWTMSVQHTREDVAAHLEALKEVASSILKVKEEMAVVEAI